MLFRKNKNQSPIRIINGKKVNIKRMIRGLPRRRSFQKESKTVSRDELAKEIFHNTKILSERYKLPFDYPILFDQLLEIEQDCLLDIAQSILNRYQLEDDWFPDKTIEINPGGFYKVFRRE